MSGKKEAARRRPLGSSHTQGREGEWLRGRWNSACCERHCHVAALALFASTLGYKWLAARAKRRELRKLTLPRESRIRCCTLIEQPRTRVALGRRFRPS